MTTATTSAVPITANHTAPSSSSPAPGERSASFICARPSANSRCVNQITFGTPSKIAAARSRRSRHDARSAPSLYPRSSTTTSPIVGRAASSAGSVPRRDTFSCASTDTSSPASAAVISSDAPRRTESPNTETRSPWAGAAGAPPMTREPAAATAMSAATTRRATSADRAAATRNGLALAGLERAAELIGIHTEVAHRREDLGLLVAHVLVHRGPELLDQPEPFVVLGEADPPHEVRDELVRLLGAVRQLARPVAELAQLRVEHLFLDLAVNGQLEADLFGDGVVAGLFVPVEEFRDRAVVALE